MAVLAAAVQHNHDLPWALSKLSELGMTIGPNEKADIYDMYQEILSSDWKKKYHNSNTAREYCVKCKTNWSTYVMARILDIGTCI